MFHHRWWDYSNRAFNLNRRICLEGFLCFGFLCMKWIQPNLFDDFNKYEFIPLVIAATV
ncbi:MAG: hypothetical protein U0L85_10145 [Bacilli bacterium]|nr:hypothetical protein [Bacilli bacterium]